MSGECGLAIHDLAPSTALQCAGSKFWQRFFLYTQTKKRLAVESYQLTSEPVRVSAEDIPFDDNSQNTTIV